MPAEDLGTATTTKVPVTGGLSVNVYAVLVDCVERGVAFGFNHVRDLCPDSDLDAAQQRVVDEVINEICSYFNFPDPPYEG